MIGLPLRPDSSLWTEFDTDLATIALHPGKSSLQESVETEHLPSVRCRLGLSVPDRKAFRRGMFENNVGCIQEPNDVFGTRIAERLDSDGLGISIGAGRPQG